jgi:hypothetical protein
MRNRSFFRTMAVGLLACSIGAVNAMASNVMVTSDGGTYDFSMTAHTTGGVTSLALTYSDVTLTSVNGIGSLPGFPVASTFSPATVIVSSSTPSPPSSAGFTTYTFTEVPGSLQIFGNGSISNAETLNPITSGFSFGGTFSVNSGISVVPGAALLETSGTAGTVYNFMPLSAPGSQELMLYNSVNAFFGNTIAHGGTITGTGSFTASAGVPEPASMALLGIGMAAVVAFRGVFRRYGHA